MSESESQIHCMTHGFQQRAYVCQHLFGSMSTGSPVGFHSSDEAEPHSDAWCSACDQVWDEAKDECTPEVVKSLGLKVVCAACYDRAKGSWRAAGKCDQ
jgi:hypothetical protein